jgi:hypothetical protein
MADILRDIVVDDAAGENEKTGALAGFPVSTLAPETGL